MTIIDDYLSLTLQYKKEYGTKTLLLMQVGSFFECYALLKTANLQIFNESDDSPESIYYGSDIQNFSDINDLVISKKNVSHRSTPVVMAGFGLPQLEKYIRRLQENDYTIVVYTQDTNTKNTTRSLSCIYSPGTYFSNDNTELTNVSTCIWVHYSASNKLVSEKITIGMSSIDIYTGDSNTMEYTIDFIKGHSIFDELENYLSINNPSECIIISNNNYEYINELITCKTHYFNYESDWVKNISKQKYQHEIINAFFSNSENLFTEWNISSQSYCFLIQFIYKHNPSLIKKLKHPSFGTCNTKLTLANHSLKQLNIISDSRYTGKYSSILSLLNNCITCMGKRAFKYSILSPSVDYNYLNKEYDITEHCILNKLWEPIRNHLSTVKDLSKIYRKMVLGKLSPKDFYTIHSTLETVNKLYLYISADMTLFDYIEHQNIVYNINEINEFLNTNLHLNNCKNFDDLSFEKFSMGNISELLLFQEQYSLELNNNLSNFNDYYKKLEDIRGFLDLTIKHHESSIKPKTSKASEKIENSEFIKVHECPKTEPVLIGTTRRVNILKKIISTIICTIFDIKSIEIKSHNGGNSMVTSNEINQISKNIMKHKDKYINCIQSEFKTFADSFINLYENSINNIINYIIKCDLLQNKCYIAVNNNYTKPIIEKSKKSYVEFTQLRHPLIEKINQNEIYVANDLSFTETEIGIGTEIGNGIVNDQGSVYLVKDESCEDENFDDCSSEIIVNNDSERFSEVSSGRSSEIIELVTEQNFNRYLLYGTNAVGKTSFIKSIGISIIMAQAGLYVPADTFKFSIYKSIYTRILGNDNLFKGLSTFAVEMTELRNILKNADSNSIILGDELCSGTESTSALSIFTAGIKYLSAKKCSFIFATHFHEIIKYSEIKEIPGLKCLHLSVIFDKTSGKLIYDRILKNGPGENMYGLEVCKSLNLPNDFLELAHSIRIKYSIGNDKPIVDSNSSKYNADKLRGLCEICKDNFGSEVHHLIYQKTAKKNIINHKANLINICSPCHDQVHSDNLILKIYKTTNGYEIM